MCEYIKLKDNCKFKFINIKKGINSMNLNLKIQIKSLVSILLVILTLTMFQFTTSKHLFEDSELKFKNKGNCYLIDNRYVHNFNLGKLNKSINLDASSDNDDQRSEKILIKFCNEESNKQYDHANYNTSLVDVVKSENHLETWYNYNYDSKLWNYDKNANALKIRLLTNKDCKLSKKDIEDNNYNDNDKNNNKHYNNETSNNNNKNSDSRVATLKLAITINIYCNNEVPEEENIRSLDIKSKLKSFINNEEECNKILNFESKLVCPLNSGLNLHRFYCEYSFVFGMIYIILGFFMLTYGNLFELATYYLVGILFSRMIILYIEEFMLFNFLHDQNDYDEFELMLWLFEGLSVLIGIMIGYYIKSFKEVKIIFLGSMTGHVVFYSVWLPLSYFITFHPFIFYFFFHVILFGLTGLISMKCFSKSNNFLIFSCAVIGSYTTMKVFLNYFVVIDKYFYF